MKEEQIKYYKTLIEGLRIKELDNKPFITTTYVNVDNEFVWYRLNSKEDFENVNNAYGKGGFLEPKVYPEIACIAIDDYDAYVYYVSDMKMLTEQFWDKLGYHMILSEK